MSADDSGPAFPCRITTDGGSRDGLYFEVGMSLRDYFASQALTGLIGKLPLFDRQGEHGISAPTIEEIHAIRKDATRSAYDYADAMLEERSK